MFHTGMKTRLIAGAAAACATVAVVAGTTAGAMAPETHYSEDGNFSAVVYDQQASAGQRQLDYKVTNISDTAQTVQGAPDGALPNPHAYKEVVDGSTYFTRNGEDTPIVLQPGESAYGEIAWSAGQPVEGGSTNLDVVWGNTAHFGFELGPVSTYAAGDTYTATNLHADPA